MTFMMFCAMELELRAVLAINTRNGEMDLMKFVKQKITVNEDFLFAWSIISINGLFQLIRVNP